MTLQSYSLQHLVDAGLAPSVRWLATGIKDGRIPGRMIGRYWKSWRMTDEDLADYLEAARPAAVAIRPATETSEKAPVPEESWGLIRSGLSARSARRLID